ncbi:hypothetical protein BT69DRAFT_1289612 [Atractiella rhizophila]|nr:hypothetical protein BT69DRAFT_1289612 [Atractiella rhizophila]
MASILCDEHSGRVSHLPNRLPLISHLPQSKQGKSGLLGPSLLVCSVPTSRRYGEVPGVAVPALAIGFGKDTVEEEGQDREAKSILSTFRFFLVFADFQVQPGGWGA